MKNEKERIKEQHEGSTHEGRLAAVFPLGTLEFFLKICFIAIDNLLDTVTNLIMLS